MKIIKYKFFNLKYKYFEFKEVAKEIILGKKKCLNRKLIKIFLSYSTQMFRLINT